MSLLELQEVSKSYRKGPAEIHAVQDVDLRVDAGTLVAVMGRADRASRPLLTIAVRWHQRVWRN